MGNAWSTHKSKREEKAKAERLRSEHCVRSPDSRLGISERLPIPTSQMKDSNLSLEENKHVDENELAASEEWKLPYKSLRPLKDSPCFLQEDVNINEASFSELRTKLEAWQELGSSTSLKHNIRWINGLPAHSLICISQICNLSYELIQVLEWWHGFSLVEMKL